jgi:hypothetical protein
MDERTVSYRREDVTDRTVASQVWVISTYPHANVTTRYERPRPFELVHDGAHFIREAERAARAMTRHVAIAAILGYAALYLLWHLAGV